MSDPNKTQIGDGNDNYGQAAKQVAKVAKQAAGTGKDAVANAATAAVKASVQGGKAAAGVAVGTATAGPWGAILMAAWSLKNTLFKIFISFCLFFVILFAAIPSVVGNYIFGFNGTQVAADTTLESVYQELSTMISGIVDDGYTYSLEKVEQIIADGGYDYDTSMDALINYGQSSAGYDAAYILAAYSASMNQQNTSEDDMRAKLDGVTEKMFPVTSVEQTKEILVPVTYSTYKSVSVTVVTKTVQTGTINGVPQYRYETEPQTYYIPDQTKTSESAVTVPEYETATVSVPVYSGGTITGTKQATYYVPTGKDVTLSPTKETLTYVECTIHPFDQNVITEAFGIDLSAKYEGTESTYDEVITNMANALKMTLYGSTDDGQAVPLTDAELIAFVNRQNCNETRKHILTTALSLVGKVPYFWGGKSKAGWNDEWNTPKLVTAAGSSSTGTLRPYGLDCSGFTDWVFKTAVDTSIQAGTWNQWDNSYAITEEELLPGDLGFLAVPGTVPVNHVLIYAGVGENGEQMWVHCSSGTGVVLNSPDYVTQYRRPNNVNYDELVSSGSEAIYTLEVEVTHYCACEKCCGSNANGTTASGKKIAVGMVAMSSHYPFGTKIKIDGTMYTVEDRGGSEIENDISRVDIYVPDHQEALRLGRYTTTAQIYQLGE